MRWYHGVYVIVVALAVIALLLTTLGLCQLGGVVR